MRTTQSIKKKLRKWQYTWKAYFTAFSPKPLPAKRFILLTMARSGSHLLIDLLNSHPDIHCITEHEMFYQRDRIRWPYHFLTGVSKLNASPVFGAKMSMGQIERVTRDPYGFLEHCDSHQWKFISLIRNNVVTQTISSQIALKRSIYHDENVPQLKDIQVEIDIPKLLKQLEKKSSHKENIRRIFSSFPNLSLSYETDLENSDAHQNTADRVFTFLGLESVPIQTRFVKTNRWKLSEVILNYKQVCQTLQGTPYEKYME